MTRPIALVLLAGLVAPACLVLACRSPDVPVVPSGFLEDYSQLERGHGEQARLIFISDVDFSLYTAAIVAPVVVWSGPGAVFEGAEPPVREALARYFEASLRAHLAREFEIPETAVPGALEIRGAIVRLQRANEPGSTRFLGSVGVELDVRDAVTGERLAAAVDAAGGDRIGATGRPGEAVDAHRVFDDWAGGAAARLAALRDYDAVKRQLDAPPE